MSAVKIELRTSVVNKALKIMRRRYPETSDREMIVGLLGEYAVAEFLRLEGKDVTHNSLCEMQYAEREGATDLYYGGYDGKRINIQVKATENDTCWITESCLKGYLSNNVHELYYVDVFIDGPAAHCWIYHKTTPQEIKYYWPHVHGGRLIHPTLHRARRKYN